MRWALLLALVWSACPACSDPSDCSGGLECYRLGSRYYDKPDLPNALRFYQKGCDAKHGASCVVAAGMFTRGEGTGVNLRRAADLRRQACELGESPSCYFLALDLETAEPARAAELYGRACASRYLPACFSLGRMYEEGRGVTASAERAADFYRQSNGRE